MYKVFRDRQVYVEQELRNTAYEQKLYMRYLPKHNRSLGC